jgi:type IV secretory pathway VirB4 component
VSARGELTSLKYAEEKKNSINPSLEIKYKDTLKVLEELQKGSEKLFNVSLYINCKATTKESLDLLTKKVETELNSLMIIPKNPYFRQIDAYRSMVPIAKDRLQVTRNITTKALSAFFPFTSPFLTLEEKGVMLGLNKNKIPYIKDIYGLSNANGVVLATSGSGKSYFTKLLIARQLLNNTKVLVIDPQAEYRGLVQEAKGELVTISRTSETTINPLDLMGHDFIEKRLALMDLFRIMFGELSEVQKGILDKALTETYARKGITADSHKGKKPPLLQDLYRTLIEMEHKASQLERITYQALINRLYLYSEGVFSFLNRPSSIDFDKNFVCFNIGDMPKQVKPVIMFLILDYVYLKMKEGKERKLLVVDEAWSLLSQAEEAGYLFEIVKTCRKFNLGLLLITQDVADLVNSKAGGAVLANSAYTFLLRQKPAIIDQVVRNFNLSQREKEYLLTATQGKGILILDNEHQEIEVVASPKEHKLITTNPNESILQERPTLAEGDDITINLNLDKQLFRGKDLSIEQKNYLTNHGYVVTMRVPIGKTNQEEFWIKTNSIESIEHTFLVMNLKEELKKYTQNIETAVSGKPDILFRNKDGQLIAIEVETGIGFSKHKKRLENKFREAKAKYGKNLYIALTNKDYRRRYETITNNTKILLRSDLAEMVSGHFQQKKR